MLIEGGVKSECQRRFYWRVTTTFVSNRDVSGVGDEEAPCALCRAKMITIFERARARHAIMLSRRYDARFFFLYADMVLTLSERAMIERNI